VTTIELQERDAIAINLTRRLGEATALLLRAADDVLDCDLASDIEAWLDVQVPGWRDVQLAESA